MAESTHFPAPRHSALVRVTHWINSFSFFALVVSGVAILIAHPRLYWGETGSVGTPSLFDLPIPFMLGHSGWGRYLHFLAAWVCVLNGLPYVVAGLFNRHLPHGESGSYNFLQRLAYTFVVFVLFPLIIARVVSPCLPPLLPLFPALVEVFGGQQSARHCSLLCREFHCGLLSGSHRHGVRRRIH